MSVQICMGSDKLGRKQGYKRIVSVGMEVEQPGSLMGPFKPAWLSKVNATPDSWHHDSSGPEEFSFLPAKSALTEIFLTFAEGVPDDKKWIWVNEFHGSNFQDIEGIIGCGSHIHLGTMQADFDDRSSKSLIQTTILWNTAVTILPFSGKFFSWGTGRTFRDKAFKGWRYAPLKSHCKRYSPSNMSLFMNSRSGRDDAFITLNRHHKDKLTMEIRANESMPQWVLPFIDVFLLIAYKHIEVGESPKLKNHRATINWLDDQYTTYGKITDLEKIIEFVEGKELYAPVPHIIGEKFPQKMTVGEFLHLIDRINYWIFAYSSRKYYTKQLRFQSLGGDPSKLPLDMMWKPWNYTVKQLMEASGDANKYISSRKAKTTIFPKIENRTHTPYAQVRLGNRRTGSEDESDDNENDPHVSPSDMLSSLLDDGLVENAENAVDLMLTQAEHIDIEVSNNGFTYITFPADHHAGNCVECTALHNDMVGAEATGSGRLIVCQNCVNTAKCPHGINHISGPNCPVCMEQGNGCPTHTGGSRSTCVSCLQIGYRCYVRWRSRCRQAIITLRVNNTPGRYVDTDSAYYDFAGDDE